MASAVKEIPEVSRCGVSAIGMEPGLALTARLGEVAVLNQQKFVAADFEAVRLVRRLNGFAGDGIDDLVFEAMAGAPVDLPEGYSFGGRRRRIERDRIGDERQLQIALPIRACRRQHTLQRTKDTQTNLVGDSRE